MNDDITRLREQIQQLKALHAEGSLDTPAYEQAKAPLERQLLDSVLAAPPAPSPAAAANTKSTSTSPQPAAKLTALLSAAVLALAGAGYWWTGSPGTPSAGAPGASRVAAADGDGAAAQRSDGNGNGNGNGNSNSNNNNSESDNEQQFAAAVEKLAQKLQSQPDNAEGWAMLARSYARLGRHALAVPAFVKAVALQGNDPRLLADYADTLAVQNNRSLAGEPMQLINKALKIDPDSPKALALAGTDAFERKDFPAAVRYWERLASVLPGDSGFLPELQASIDQARELGGLPKAPPVRPAATAVMQAPPAMGSGTVAAAAPGTTGAPVNPSTPGAVGTAAAPATANAGSVQGSVRLAPALAAQAAPTDTVFIFARAAEGPRMPLAILRHQVKDLPLNFKLDDSTAMSPATRLSLHPRVVVSARISKSGQAAPSAGDLMGQSAAVANTAQGLAIEINEVVKN